MNIFFPCELFALRSVEELVSLNKLKVLVLNSNWVI